MAILGRLQGEMHKLNNQVEYYRALQRLQRALLMADIKQRARPQDKRQNKL